MAATDQQPARLLLGTSGWSYKDWVGPFYPTGASEKQFLSLYSQAFPTVEIDSTFYGIPRASAVTSWVEQTPTNFIFSAKVPQVVTHQKVLHDAGSDMTAFVEALEPLQESGKLGALLLQFPYGFKADQFDSLARFLPTLPSGPDYALEVRHKSWLGDRFYDLLREHNVALALIDHPWMPRLEVTTAPFTYIRWLGDREKINTFEATQIDRSRELTGWADKVERLRKTEKTVYGYFNNHYAGHSPASARQFAEMVAA